MVLTPKESAKLVAGLAKDVSIIEGGVKMLSQEVFRSLQAGDIGKENFSQVKFHPKRDNPWAADWIFVLDTLNFSFWPKDKKAKKWTVCGETGYFALCAAVKRAIDEGWPMWTPKFYQKISRSNAEFIFRSDDNGISIPLIDERVKCLREAGNVLMEKYDGTFVECIKSCEGSAQKLLQLIVKEFDSYRDEANYEGHKINLYKRAQILVGDIWSCFKGRGLGHFHDIDSITMFADYRVPQVLIFHGAMQYSSSLMNKLKSDEPLEQGSREEVEIRACSIEVVERVCNEVQGMIADNQTSDVYPSDVNAIVIDHYLWDYRRKHADELEYIPFHKTRTIYY